MEEQLKRITAQLSYALYQIAIATEEQAEKVVIAAIDAGADEVTHRAEQRVLLLEQAKELLIRSLEVCWCDVVF